MSMRTVLRLVGGLVGATFAMLICVAAWGFWPEDGDGDGEGITGTLSAPGAPGANAPTDSSTVTVSWSAGSLGTGEQALGYSVNRVRTVDGAVFAACGTSLTSTVSALGCADLDVVDGTYRYRITAVYRSWTAVSALGLSVTVVNDSSLPTVRVVSISPTPNGNGYNNSSPVQVLLNASDGNGIESISYSIDSGTTVITPSDSVTIGISGDGIHTLSYSTKDRSGKNSESANLLIRIDTVAPGAPGPPDLVTASDSGISSTDNITKVTTPTFSGTAEDGSTVALFDGATQVGNGTVNGGLYTIVTGTLTQGTHTITARATDQAGNAGPVSGGLVVTIDTAAPATPSAPTLTAASDSGSSTTDRITNVTTPTFTGTAEPGSTVTLYNSSTAVGTAVTAADGTYSVTSSTLAAGSRLMTVKAADPAGNVSATSASTTVTVDTTAPAKTGTPVLPAASDTGRSSADKNTRINTPTFTGTTTADTTVYVYDGSTVIGSVYAPGTTFSITVGALTDGTHVITVRAADTAGNLSTISTSISVVIDTVAPAATSAPTLTTASDTGRSTTDRITKATTPIVTGTNETRMIVALFDAGTAVGSVTTTSTTYSVTSSTLAAGTHTLSTVPTDVAGNVGPASAVTTVTIDVTAPATPSLPVLAAASDTGVSNSDGITRSTALVYTGSAEDNASVALFDSATATGSAAIAATGGAFTATTGTLANGAHSISAKATDVAGNVSVGSGTVPVTVDTVVPTVTVNQAAGQSDPTSTSQVDFTVTFSENVTAITGAAVTVSGTAGAITSTVTGSGTAYTARVSTMTKSGTVIAAVAAGKTTDVAGNASTASTTTDNTVTYNDVNAPAAPSAPNLAAASDTGVSNSDRITRTTTPILTGTAEIGATVKLFDGLTQVGAVVATAGTWSITSTTLTNGTHSLTATATDPTGNVSMASDPTGVTIDTAAPTAMVGQAVGQSDPTTGTSIGFAVMFNETVVALTDTGVTVAGTAGATTATVSGTGSMFTATVTSMTRTGTVIVTVAAARTTDIAGNANTASTAADNTVTFNDTTAPVVTISGFAPATGQTATVSGTAGLGFGDTLTVTVVLCTQNVFPCAAGNTKATLTGVAVNATTGAWTVTSGTLGSAPALYARATQTDATGNIGTSAVAGPIAIP